MSPRAWLLLTSILLAGSVACAQYVEDPDADAVSAHTRGTVTEKPGGLGSFAFLIEARPEHPSAPGVEPAVAGDKYYVEVRPETTLERRTETGDVVPATPDDVVVGAEAEVWFIGPIRESYPMQGTAHHILILDRPRAGERSGGGAAEADPPPESLP